MSNYSKTTDFAAKDSLPSGDAAKIIRGSEFETEFDNISTAIATKADSANPTFTGTVTIDGLTVNGNTTLGDAATDTVTVTADIASNLIPSADNTHDLGASGAEWKDLYVNGTAYVDTLDLNGTIVTSTAAELNILDGVTSTAAELNLIDGSTAGTVVNSKAVVYGASGEVNATTLQVGGVAITSTPAELNLLDGATVTTAEINILDGVTATTAELNILDGVTSTTAELNILDGVTSTATELNLLDGITGILDEDNMASNSATALATQQSIKAYVDSQVATADALSEVLGNGNTTGGTDIAVSAGDDITFVDNSKAIFGTGSDLNIYHDGSNSYVQDSGTGNLILRGANFVVDAQTSGNARLITANATSKEVKLYYDDGQKLATTSTGIDVTGTVTADGLTVESDTILLDSASSAFMKIDRGNNTSFGITRYYTSGTEDWRLGTINDGTSDFYLQDSGNAERFKVGTNGDVSLYEDTGATAKFFWDASAESLGIGTGSPSQPLHVVGSGFTTGRFSSTNTTSRITFDNSGQTNESHTSVGAVGADLQFRTNNSERLRINSSGNVGIGTSAPASILHAQRNGTAVSGLDSATVATFQSTGSAGSSSRVNILAGATGSTGQAILTFGDADDPDIGRITYRNGDNSMAFTTNTSEAMRIDSSGNLLVGKTSTSIPTVGIEARPDGVFAATRDSNTVGFFNRNTSDGAIVHFRKDNATVGTISAATTNVIYGNDTRGLKIEDALIIPRDIDDTTADNQMDLGSSTSRWKNLYLSGGAYLGGTAAANKLDDYEEGTWTPVVADASTGGNTATGTFSGRYTKVGNLVCVQLVLTNINTTGLTAGNQLFVRNLPFQTVSGNFTNSAPYTNNVTFSGYLTSVLGTTRTFLYFQDNNSGAGNTNLVVSEINSGVSDIALTTFYETS